MSRFTRNGFMASMGAIIAVGIGISLLQDAGGSLSKMRAELGLGGGGEPALVIFVSGAQAVAQVRAAVADERIVAESPRAFALREGRIIADGNEAVGEIVVAAGWIDRDLKLMRARSKERTGRKDRPLVTASRGQSVEGGCHPRSSPNSSTRTAGPTSRRVCYSTTSS